MAEVVDYLVEELLFLAFVIAGLFLLVALIYVSIWVSDRSDWVRDGVKATVRYCREAPEIKRLKGSLNLPEIKSLDLLREINLIRNLNTSVFSNETQYGKGLNINDAINQGLLRILSITGKGLYSAQINLEQIGDQFNKIEILIPLGAALVSKGEHQNMVVRDDTFVELYQIANVEVPVTCLEFFKKVPTELDSFSGIEQATHLVRIVLEIARKVNSSSFITQLAIWLTVENVPPEMVTITTRRRSRRIYRDGRYYPIVEGLDDPTIDERKPTYGERLLTREIASKAKELFFSRQRKAESTLS